MGGAWERMVTNVKKAPKLEALLTLLAEVESTINSRPLTCVGEEVTQPEAFNS